LIILELNGSVKLKVLSEIKKTYPPCPLAFKREGGVSKRGVCTPLRRPVLIRERL
jgi:hypothetical protein